MFVFDDAGATGRRAVIGIVLSALTLVGAVAAWRFVPVAEPTSTPSADKGAYLCAVIGDDEAEKQRAMELCRRQAEDAARRAPRPSQDPVDPEAMRIHNAVSAAVCHIERSSICASSRPAGDADVTTVRAVLAGLGHSDAVVRLQRTGDPAPDGSVVYAIRLPGDRCLVAFAPTGRASTTSGLSGLLPNGDCLTV